MIRLQDLVPNVYYEKSRDFQFIGRLFDIVLNSVKTNSDTLYNLPGGKNKDERLLNLLAFTLGFQPKHHYNSKQLEAICSVLPLIIKNKGSLGAIIIATNALLHAEGLTQPLDYSITPRENITLYLPTQLSDLTLLSDLMTYILPAGIYCNFVKEISKVTEVETITGIKSEVIISKEKTGYYYNRLLKASEVNKKNRGNLVDDNNTTDVKEGQGVLMTMEIEKVSGGN
jgi:hypothetical protein